MNVLKTNVIYGFNTKYLYWISLFVFGCLQSLVQDLTGQQLLEKTIAYHDPNHKWSTFNDQLLVTMDTPNTSSGKSKISINLPSELFYIQASRDMITSVCKLDKIESTAN